MARPLLSLSLLLLVFGVAQGQEGGLDETGNQDDPAYWLARRDQFYRATRFNLSEANLNFYGGPKFTFLRTGHLPFWFDYQLFKKVFNKTSQASTPTEERARHNLYINSCLRAIKERTLFRMLAATRDTLITSQADQFYHERLATRPTAKPSNKELKQTNNNQADDYPTQQRDDNIIQFSAEFFAHNQSDDQDQDQDHQGDAEQPLDRAVRLMKLEMDQVESRNQVEAYLKAFNEVDGSALAGRLPY